MMSIITVLLMSIVPAQADMDNSVENLRVDSINHACIVHVSRTLESGFVKVYCNSDQNSLEVNGDNSELKFSSIRIYNSKGNATDDLQTMRALLEVRFTDKEGYRGQCGHLIIEAYENQIATAKMTRQIRGATNVSAPTISVPAITNQYCKFVR